MAEQTGAATTAATTTTQAADTSKTATTQAAATTAAAATTGQTGAAQTTSKTDTTTQSATVAESKGAWPDNWLERVSKGDEKAAKVLGRYASPEALAEGHLQLRRKLDSGEYRQALPKNPKPEEIAAWRKDNGIPQKPEEYDLKDLKIPKEDKDVVAGLVSRLHAKNASNDVVREAIGGFYDEQKRQAQARSEKDETERLSVIDALGSEWGGKFSSYKGRVENVLTIFPETVRDALKSARLPDGTAIFNHPDIMRGFLALSLRDIPEGVVVGAGDGDLGKSMTDRYKEIGKVMRENRKVYDKDAGMQKEYASLIEALEKHDLIDRNGNLKERKAA